MLTRKQAKVELKRKGWSYRRVAPLLGMTYVQLDRILNGRSNNPDLLAAIEALPTFDDWKKANAEHHEN